VHDNVAHTAEHAFIGSLQKLLGQTLKVRKVEHKSSGNTAFIVIPQLDLDIVFRAEAEVNSLITEGRQLRVRTFPSLEDGKRNIPNLRANEDRIAGEVRVVEIENHDVAACAMDHVNNLRECDFFLVTRLSKSGSEYEVDFSVGQQAKDAAIVRTARLLRVSEVLHANVNTIEDTAKKLMSENGSNSRKLRALSKEKLLAITPIANNRMKLLKGVFENLADDQLKEFAGEKIGDLNTVVLVSNAGAEMASVVFARNESLRIDCNEMFKRHLGSRGRGGGKPHFVTGAIQVGSVEAVFDSLTKELLDTSSQ
jgi:alanyl-tRNA synthetase